MSKSVENYNKKRDLIVSSARRLFLQNGYTDTGMDDVAADAGVTKQTVYRYFVSKTELFAAVVDSMSERRGGHVFGRRGVLEELISYGEKFISGHMEQDRLDMWRLMIAESRENGPVAPVFRDRAQNVWSKPLVDFLRGKLALTEPELYADMFNSMLLVMRPKIVMGLCPVPDVYEIRKHAEVTAEIFVNGVLGL